MPKILLIAICSILILTSCKKEHKKEKLNEVNKETVSFPVDFPELKESEIKQFKEEIHSFYTSKINLDDFSGSFLVAKNGQILFENYIGFSNYKEKSTITENTPLHLASISKVLTASVILRMVDENKISLEDSFQKYFPKFPFEKITIRILLNHRSGLPNYAYFTDNDSIWDKSKTLKNSDVLDLLCSKEIPLDFTPNTKFSYSNTNYALLASLIEKVSKMSFPIAMQKLLFEPLQMNNTFVFELEKQKDSISQSYKSTWEKIPYDHLDAVYGDKNIYSTPKDLLKFDIATYSENFYSNKLRSEIFKGYSYERPGVKNYGLGIRLNEWDHTPTLFYHNGWWHGNTNSYTTLKNEKVCIIALSNKYTRKVYQAKKLSSIFGNYPFEIEEE
ncbi:serine hydrolase domain-containing protein [Flavobacterium okayamense]|uniref:Penicillin-binding protein n=1 Tax=Flavobacterium okayamense TaxID=2830782 RepID=A0ABM7SDU8_9FLAO|nr:serine hydrolase domain-containing protein [Flavobacterium okayamense]BCY29377.1 penicillin-binding protein [Flavobacterium okayamense]